MISRILLVVCALVLTLGLSDAANEPQALKNIARLSDLATDFNGKNDQVRIVALLSPT